MELLIMYFSPVSCHVLSLRSQHSPQHHACYSLHVRGRVSHPRLCLMLFTSSSKQLGRNGSIHRAKVQRTHMKPCTPR